MSYTYTPTIWPSFLITLLLVALAAYSGRRRSVPGALPFMVACLFGAAWAAGSVMEYAALDLPAKIAWVKFQSACQMPVVTAVTGFILEYAWPGRWLNRRNLVLLSIPWLLHIGLLLTMDLHHLLWTGIEFNGTVHPKFGPAGWLLVAYALVLLGGLNLVVFGWLFRRSPLHRWPVVVMLVGQTGGRAVYMLDRADILQSVLPLALFGMAFEFLMYALALFNFRILDPIPMARRTAIEQMRAGMLVLDSQGKIISLNPYAVRILGVPASRARGRSIQELLPACSDQLLTGSKGTELEFSLGEAQEVQYFTIEISALNDWRGLEAGRLVMLHNVTGQKQAHDQIVEQQRALATLRERERLGRELHDDLAQDLALINLQAQLACDLLDAGQAGEAREQLQILAKTARAAQVDVRGEIHELAHRSDQDEDFLGALQRLVETFQQTNGIAVELVLPGNHPAIPLTPTAEVQLLRIIQEAFTNIRKHARATHVQVTLANKPGCLELIIEDDGVGFDSNRLPGARQTFGLAVMSERATEVGGSVAVHSASGEGTRVIIEVPA